MVATVPTSTWKKKTSGLWSVAGNWSGGAPLTGANVIIAPVTAETVTFNIGDFTIGALTLQGATLNLTRGTLIARNGATLTTATVTGAHALVLGGTSSVAGLTVGGGAVVRNRGVVTQSGGIAIGDAATSTAGITNLAGATWIDANNGVISATGGFGFVNSGLFEDSAGTGATAISAKFVSTGTLSVVTGGALVFTAVGAQTQLSGTINGGGAVEYGPTDWATLGALTVTTTNQNNLGIVDQTGTLTLIGAQTIENLGHWNLDGDVSMLVGAGANPANEFISTGVFAKTAGTGVSVVGASVNIAGAVNVAGGTIDFAGATSGFAGAISGAGTFQISSGTAQFEPGVSNNEAISVAHFLLSGGTTDIIGFVTDTGAFEGDIGATLAISGALALSGPADLAGLDAVSGGAGVAGELIVNSATTVSGAIFGGSMELFDRGVVTQSGGNVTLGDTVPTDAASIVLGYGGVWNIADASGIGLGTDPGSILNIGANGTVGLLEKSGAGVSKISPVILNNSLDVTTVSGVTYEGIEAAAGILDIYNIVAGTGSDNIVGAATLEFDNAVAAGQTISFFGAGGALALNDAPAFKGAITGFDTTGSNDALLILAPTYGFAGATETASAATLTFSNGASTFSLTLTGDYQSGAFTAQTLANGQIKITH